MIAEACDNHMGSLEVAKALARAAKHAGCDAVKFQHHIAYEEMLKIGKMSDNFDEHLYDFLETNALSLEQHVQLKYFCDEIQIQYLCTPFSAEAARQIAELVPFFKIGSGEFQDLWFVDQLKEIGLPVLFSTGMCSWDELVSNVSNNFDSLDFALMNCLSEYPPKYEDLNLGVVDMLLEQFPDHIIGHSDHTQTLASSLIAVAKGAQIIEKHITISSFISGPDKNVSLNPEDFRLLVDEIRNIPEMLGSHKILHEREKDVRSWAYRSVVAAQDITQGTVLTEEMIKTKRPGSGIPSSNYREILGKRAKSFIKSNELIILNHIE